MDGLVKACFLPRRTISSPVRLCMLHNRKLKASTPWRDFKLIRLGDLRTESRRKWRQTRDRLRRAARSSDHCGVVPFSKEGGSEGGRDGESLTNLNCPLLSLVTTRPKQRNARVAVSLPGFRPQPTIHRCTSVR